MRFRWRIRAGRCWPIDWMDFRWSWRYSLGTWRWRPLFWNLWRGEHLRPTKTTLVELISTPRWPITWITLPCAGGSLITVCHVEWRVLIELWSAWKWWWWRQVTIGMWRLILIGLCPKSTVFASGSSWTVFRWIWIFFTALLCAK